MGPTFLRNTSLGILQYIPMKLFMSVVVLVTAIEGVYEDGQFTPNNAYFWVTGVVNFSQITAMYCLVLFYQGTKEELFPIKPIPKFVSIKAVIFFTWWQGVIIEFLLSFGILKKENVYDDPQWSTQDIGQALQAFIICVEMLLFSALHHYAFPVNDFIADKQGHSIQLDGNEPLLTKVIDAVNLSDVAKDVQNSRSAILTKKQELMQCWDQRGDSRFSDNDLRI